MTVLTEQVQIAPTSAEAAAAKGDAEAIQSGPPYSDPVALDAHVNRAWAHFRSLGSPQWHVAPMVDQSELPFRMLCRAHGAQAAYTPMLHARLFLEHKQYRSEHFSTCPEDRPLFVQFCANEPDIFVAAAALVQDHADYIDLNLGCPQRIAKRGYYGAFLMDELQRVKALVAAAATQLRVPVSCKIRLFPELQQTLDYALMLQEAGCSLLAVHGRTRDMKDHAAHRADWAAIAAVRQAVRIPVLANGDVRCLSEARALMAATGADGVMSAEPLLLNPRLFSTQVPHDATELPPLAGFKVCQEYLQFCQVHPSHMRMVRGHVHKLITGWLAEFPDIRQRMHKLPGAEEGGLMQLQQLLSDLGELIAATGRDHPIPKLSERKLKQMEREAAKAAAIAEQDREAAALAELAGGTAAAAASTTRQQEQQRQQHKVEQQAAAGSAGVAVAVSSSAAGVDVGTCGPADQQQQQQQGVEGGASEGAACGDAPPTKRQAC